MQNVILCQAASDKDNKSKSMKALREKLPPCPICGKKAILDHDVVNGYDFGYSVGCTAFRINDGVHGFVRTEIFNNFNDTYNPKMPSFHGCDTKEEAFEKWVNYCKRFKGNKE